MKQTKINVVVVGNCQSRPIAQLIETYGENVSITAIAVVHLLKNEQFPEYEDHFKKADLIVSQLVNDAYPCEFVTTNFLKKRYGDKVLTIVNLYYKGYTPDWFYIRLPQKVTLRGPMGDYHNKTIFESWKLGLSIEDTVKRLHSKKFNEKFKSYSKNSLLELQEREMNADVKITDYIKKKRFKKRLFFTFNHPSYLLLEEYVKRILKQANIRTKFNLFNFKRGKNKNEPLGQFKPIINPIASGLMNSMESNHEGVDFQLVSDNAKIGQAHTYSSFELVENFYRIYDFFDKKYQLRLTVNLSDKAKKIIKLGYDLTEKLVTYQPASNNQNVVSINLAKFISQFSNKGLFILKQEFLKELSNLSNKLNCSDIVVMDNTPLYEDIRNSIEFNQYSSEIDNLIHELVVVYTKHFKALSIEKVNIYPESLDVANMITPSYKEIINWENKLYVRFGNVELRVLNTYIFRNKDLKPTIAAILKNISNEEFLYAGRLVPGNWFSADNISYNLRQLMTNAGFYSSSNAIKFNSELQYWAELYSKALLSCDYLFLYRLACLNFLRIEADFKYVNQKEFNYCKFPEPQNFYRSIAGKKVLFVSPFAEQLNESYQSGAMFNLYHSFDIEYFDFKAIPSFLSTYPNRPHSGWKETFEELCRLVDEEMANTSFDIFFASCGLYGIPLCDYVHKKYLIPTVYNGNHTNTLFGIMQKSNVGFMKDHKNVLNWKSSHLGSKLGVERIDNGRYV